MIEVAPDLYVGSGEDFKHLSASIGMRLEKDWSVVHACKEPFHRDMLGYKGRAAPKDHPEYLFGYRGNRLILNLVDVEDKAYVDPTLIHAAIDFIASSLHSRRKVLVHCNQGRSRSPTIAMLYMAPALDPPFERAEDVFRGIYPDYAPAKGMREFAAEHWASYRLPTR